MEEKEEKDESKNTINISKINKDNENDSNKNKINTSSNENEKRNVFKEEKLKYKERFKKMSRNLISETFDELTSENDELHSSKYQLFSDKETECDNINMLQKMNIKGLVDSDSNDSDKNDNDNNSDSKDVDSELPTCAICNKKYHKNEKIDIFGTCKKCTYSELQEIMLELYDVYLKNVSHGFKRYSVKITNFFERILNKMKIKDSISISDTISSYGFNKFKIFAKIKNKICLICQKEISNDYFYSLTCGCKLCSERCFNQYLDLLIGNNFNQILKNNFRKVVFVFEECICGTEYYYDDYVALYDFLKSKNNKKYCGMITKIIKNRWLWRCVRCDQVFDPSNLNNRITIIDNKIKKDFYNKELTHFICSECTDYLKRRNETSVRCLFCKSEHAIIKSKKLSFENKVKDNCLAY